MELLGRPVSADAFVSAGHLVVVSRVFRAPGRIPSWWVYLGRPLAGGPGGWSLLEAEHARGPVGPSGVMAYSGWARQHAPVSLVEALLLAASALDAGLRDGGPMTPSERASLMSLSGPLSDPSLALALEVMGS